MPKNEFFKSKFNKISASKGDFQEAQKLKAAVFSNIALCNLKLESYYEVKKAVSKCDCFFTGRSTIFSEIH